MQLENGGQVDLSSFLSKPQQLRLESNLLSLENGGQVDLSEFIDLPQQIHLNESILQLDRGGECRFMKSIIRNPRTTKSTMAKR